MGRGFLWTEQKRQAARLCAEWGVTQRETAERVGVTLRTVEGWLRRPAFQAAVETCCAEIRAENAAFWAAERAKAAQTQREAEQRHTQMLAQAKAEVQVWIAWKMACHRARDAHRKLPPEPPGMRGLD